MLTHRTGVPFASGSKLGDAITMTSWDRAVRQAELARPRWPAGQLVGYHAMTYGFILGELIRRMTGSTVSGRLAADLLRPLGLRNTYLGRPAALWPRHVPVQARTWVWNRRRARQAVIPAAGISATARDLALFYQMLLGGGQFVGIRVLQPGTVADATQVSCDGEADQVLSRPVRYAHGFMPGWPGRVTVMGTGASPRAFGHARQRNLCNAWADPASGLVVVYLTNRVVASQEGLRHQCEVSDAIRAAYT